MNLLCPFLITDFCQCYWHQATIRFCQVFYVNENETRIWNLLSNYYFSVIFPCFFLFLFISIYILIATFFPFFIIVTCIRTYIIVIRFKCLLPFLPMKTMIDKTFFFKWIMAHDISRNGCVFWPFTDGKHIYGSSNVR